MSGFGLHNSAASPNTMQAANAINGVNNTLNNVAWVMLSKIKSPEELEALRQHANAYGAAARLHNAQADAAATAATEAASAPTVFAQNVAGMTKPQFDAYQGYKNTGSWGMTDAVDDPEKQMTIAPRAKTAADYNISQEMVSAANAAAAEFAGKGRGQAHVAETMKAGVLQPAALGQTVDPAKLQNFATADYAVSGKPVFHVDGHGAVTNMLTGMVDTNNPMARSYIGVNNASANQHNAAAANSNQQARYHGALADGAAINNMPTAVTTTDGRTINLTSEKAAPLVVKQDTTADTNASRERAAAGHDAAKLAAAGGKGGKFDGKQLEAMAGEIAAQTPQDFTIPRDQSALLKEWTEWNFHNSTDPAVKGNMTGAVAASMRQVYGDQGPQKDAIGHIPFRNFRPANANMTRPGGVSAAPSPTGVSAAMVGGVPPVGKKGPSIQTPVAASVPQTKVEATVAQARDAIAKGANRGAVEKRLRDAGIDPALIDAAPDNNT